ncbi:type II secretion system protein GspD [Candidatus Omnitrophota bacterium]
MKKISIVLLTGAFLLCGLEAPASYQDDFFDDSVYGEYLIGVSKKKISMDLENASLVNTLKVLSQQTGLNFVSSPTVQDRTLTLYMSKVPLREAMDTIFKANNLTYDFYPDSDIFIVKELGIPALEVETRVYFLQHARVTSSQLSKEIATAFGGADSGETSIGMVAAVQKVMSASGTVVEDPRTNSLIVTDVPPQFVKIENVIKSLDIPVQKVMIEVEILEVTKDFTDRMGFLFESGINLAYSGGSRSTSWPLFWNAPSERAFDSANFGKAQVTLGDLDASGTTILFELIKQDTTTKFLARPKILTLSGETAEIKLTTDEAISVSKTEDAETSDVEYQVERAETGTSLRVTAHVNPITREVTMLVQPRVAQAVDTEFNFADFDVKDVRQRTTTNLVVLRENHTLVIGGLLSQNESETKTKVPFLGDLPLIGAAFRHEDSQIEERELLIFITPHILQDTPELVQGATLAEPREQSRRNRDSAIDNSLAKFEDGVLR